MNTTVRAPQPGPGTLTFEQAGRLYAVERDLHQMAQQLVGLRDTLHHLRLDPAVDPAVDRAQEQGIPVVPAPSVTAGFPPPAAGSRPSVTPSSAPLFPPLPGATARPVAPSEAPMRAPWWRREGALAKVLSAIGAGVLLLGLVFLLVLAVQYGIFGPVARVASGAAVSALLVGIGLLVQRRQPGNIGASALAATGFAGAYLVVLGTTAIYQWLPPLVGLLLAALIGGVGLWLARAWNAQILGVIVVLGAVLLSPAVANDHLWQAAAFAALVGALAFIADLRGAWPFLVVARIVAPALVLLGGSWSDASSLHPTEKWVFAAVATGFGLVAIAQEVWRSNQLGDAPTARVRHLVVPIMITTAGLTMIILAHRVHGAWLSFGWLVGAGVVLIMIALLSTVRVQRSVLLATAAASLAISVTAMPYQDAGLSTMLLIPLGFMVVALLRRDRVAGIIGLVLSAIALSWFMINGLAVAIAEPIDPLPWMIVASLLALLVIMAGYQFGRIHLAAMLTLWTWLAWTSALVAIMTIAVAAGTMIGVSAGNQEAGYLAGHAVATVLWVGIASWLLVRQLQAPSRRNLLLGLIIAGGAIAKLLLWDLQTLDGIFRVLAFVLIGAALLALGTLYSRALRTSRPGALSIPRTHP